MGPLALVQVRHWHALLLQTRQVVEMAALRLGYALKLQRLDGRLSQMS